MLICELWKQPSSKGWGIQHDQLTHPNSEKKDIVVVLIPVSSATGYRALHPRDCALCTGTQLLSFGQGAGG